VTIEAAPRTPSLAELLAIHADTIRRSMHVMLPGRIEKYDAAQQRADVKPLIQDRLAARDGSEILEEFPVIPSVPVVFPRAGGFFITLPVARGDLVTLIFADRSLDNFKSSRGQVTDPDDFRTHDLSDAIAFVGFYPFGRSLSDSGVSSNLVIGKESGAQVHVKPDEVDLYEENAADFVALDAKTRAQIDTVIGDVNALKAVFSAWVVAPGDGGGALKAAAAAWYGSTLPSAGSVAAAKVKAT
jgi:hypothetical protein